MLVSLFARLNATAQMHNAQYAMMQNRINMLNACRNLPYFTGSLATLNEMDKQFSMNNALNESLYMLSSAQYDAAKKMMAQEAKDNKISYIT